MTIQLKDKTLITPKEGEELEETETGYALWKRYENECGEFWNKVRSFKDSEVLAVFG
jgi:hypothetical protein